MDPIEELLRKFRRQTHARQRNIVLYGGTLAILIYFFLFTYWVLDPGRLFISMGVLAFPVLLILTAVFAVGRELGKKEGRIGERQILQGRLKPFIRKTDLRVFNSLMTKKVFIRTSFSPIIRKTKVAPSLEKSPS